MNTPVQAEKITQLVELLNDGLTVSGACRICRVPSATFYYLKKTHPELSVSRSAIIIGRLIRVIEQNPSWNNQQICDACSVNITSFYKFMRKSPLLREARTATLELKSRLPRFTSFYAEQLFKQGYTLRRIKSICGPHAVANRRVNF